MSVDKYLSLVPSQNRNKAKFISTLSASLKPLVHIQNVVSSIPEKFDIDNAKGHQLDVVGQWVGISRFIQTPLVGIYFEWGGSATVGWGSGIWKDTFSPTTGLTELPDEFYRTLIRAKIAANRWDGSIPQAYAIWKEIFESNTIVIQDMQDMSMVVGIVGEQLDAVTQALLIGGYLTLKPEGVGIKYYAIPTNDGPIFVWGGDESGVGVAGWGEGSWAVLITP